MESPVSLSGGHHQTEVGAGHEVNLLDIFPLLCYIIDSAHLNKSKKQVVLTNHSAHKIFSVRYMRTLTEVAEARE